MRWHRFVCVLAGLLLASAAAAASEPSSKPFNISTPQSFHEQAAQVRTGMQPDGIYAFLSTQGRTRVEHLVGDMDALLRRYGNIQVMTGAQRVELFNAQESANQLLTRGRTGNIRCAWTPPTGSNIARTVCWHTAP